MLGRLDERGESLVEVLMTVTIVSIAVVGIITGIGTAASSSKLHRDAASATVALVIAAEAIEASAPPAATCEVGRTLDDAPYETALSSLTDLPDGWDVDVSAACAEVAEIGLPHVTLRATPPSGTSAGAAELVVVPRRAQ